MESPDILADLEIVLESGERQLLRIIAVMLQSVKTKSNH